ncbi:hypothetical protein ACSSS7_002027 [Eimeria intestinalis]
MSRGGRSKGVVPAPLGFGLLCLASLFPFFTDVVWSLPHVEPAVEAPPLLSGAAPFSPFSGMTFGRGASNQEDSLAASYVIHYEGCGAPLVVGGEVVRCEGGTKSSKPPPGRSGNRPASGPLLNQMFFVEVSADIRRRSAASRQRTSANTPSASAARKSDASNAAAEPRDDGWGRVKGVSEEPHFLRVFGRWVPFARGLHMWLDTDITATPLRRLSAEVKSEAAHHDPHSLQKSSQGFQGLSGNPASGIAAPVLPRGRSPYVYWRQSVLPPAVQSLCVALIKQPAGERGAFATLHKPATSHIPDSCEEAQKLLTSVEAASAVPVWLSCGPQLELSRLTHFLTFMIPQEKMDQVLAALDYNVDVWREPHYAQSDRDSNNVPPVDGGGAHASHTNSIGAAAGDIQQKQEGSDVSSETQQAVPPARDVEARRLAGLQGEDEAAEDPPKWRLGVCLLKASQAAPMDRVVPPSHKAESEPLSDQGNSSASEAKAAPSSSRQEKAQNMRGAREGLQAVREAQEEDLQKLALGSTDPQLVGEISLRERLQRLVLVQQRDAVEQLLMRELGLTAEDREEQDDEDDEDEVHTCPA